MTDYIVKGTADRKYARQLLARLPKGYKIGMIAEASDGTRPVRMINQNHPCVLTPDGHLLKSSDGRPVSVCGTPGDTRSLANDLKTIERAIRYAEERR